MNFYVVWGILLILINASVIVWYDKRGLGLSPWSVIGGGCGIALIIIELSK